MSLLLTQRRLLASGLLLTILALVLHRTRGQYEYDRDVLWLAVGWLAFLFIADGREPGPLGLRPISALLGALYLVFAFVLAKDARLLYAEPVQAQVLKGLLQAHAVVALGVVALGLLSGSRPRVARPFAVAAGLAGLALITARVLVLWASPQPQIDVYTTVDKAIDLLLSGQNPYAAQYGDIYARRYDYQAGMVYPPGALLAATLGRLLSGDLRSAYLLADVLGAVGLGVLCRAGRVPWVPAALCVLLWLSFPVSLFVLEQGFIDPLFFPCLAALAWALFSERPLVAGVALGLLLATKQYGVLALVPLAAALIARGSIRGWPQMLAGAAATATLLIAPFFFWGPSAFWSTTVALPLSYAARSDALTLAALFQNRLHRDLPSLVPIGLLLLALLLTGLRARRAAPLSAFAIGAVAIFGAAFLGAKQAFCNYYQLLAYAAALALCSALRSDPESAPSPSRPDGG